MLKKSTIWTKNHPAFILLNPNLQGCAFFYFSLFYYFYHSHLFQGDPYVFNSNNIFIHMLALNQCVSLI